MRQPIQPSEVAYVTDNPSAAYLGYAQAWSQTRATIDSLSNATKVDQIMQKVRKGYGVGKKIYGVGKTIASIFGGG